MELLIHIGFPKTGNVTFHYLYLKSKEINYLAQSKNTTYRKSTGVFNLIWESMIYDNTKIYKKKININKKKIISSLSSTKKNVLLIEGISDFFFYYRRKKVDFLKRLKILETQLSNKVNTKVILILRNQPDFIVSRYIESSQFFSGLKSNWTNFKNVTSYFSNLSKKNKYEKDFFNHLKYSYICLKLFKIFKRKKVNIFFFEELKYDTHKFSKKLSNLLKLNYNNTYNFLNKNQLNQSYYFQSVGHLPKKKQMNYKITNNKIYEKINKYIPLRIKRLVKNFITYLDVVILFIKLNLNIDKKIEINPKDKYLIKKHYYNDNKKLENILNVKLKKYGYY